MKRKCLVPIAKANLEYANHISLFMRVWERNCVFDSFSVQRKPVVQSVLSKKCLSFKTVPAKKCLLNYVMINV